MKNQEKFIMNDIPWKELQEMGISEAAFLDFPKDVIDRILTGNNSPLVNLSFKNVQGEQVQLPAKFRFERDKNGELQVIFQPKRMELQNDYYLSPSDLERLDNLETILVDVMTEKGMEKCWLQKDHELNAIDRVKEDDVKIPEAIGYVVLGEAEKQQIREGKPVQLEVDDIVVTVGVDINARNGFRVVNGDMDEWKQKKLEQWDRITPGAQGYWQTSENGWQYQKHLERGEKRTQEEKQDRGLGRGFGIRRG